MCNMFNNSITLLLVILKLCISTSGNFTIGDLAVTCGVCAQKKLTEMPPECTAMAVKERNLTVLLEHEKIKGALPLLILTDHISFSHIGDTLKNDFKVVYQPYLNTQFDFMVFVNTFQDRMIPEDESNVKYTEELSDFFKKSKEFYPGKLFGMLVNRDVKWLVKVIDLKKVNEHVDFYFFENTYYRECDYHIHQKDMNVLVKKDDLLETLKQLKESGILLDKLIYPIELKIESVKFMDIESMNYTYLCSNELSDDRKYCFNTIECLFEKARLRISEGTAGIYIHDIEYDDFDGSCGCKTLSDSNPKFRGLKTIAGASQENANDLSFYDCHEGLYPVIKG